MAFSRETLGSGFTKPDLHHGFLETLSRLCETSVFIVFKENVQEAKVLFETRKTSQHILYQYHTRKNCRILLLNRCTYTCL